MKMDVRSVEQIIINDTIKGLFLLVLIAICIVINSKIKKL